MDFIIENKRIELLNYKDLNAFVSQYKVCEDIINFLDKWFDDNVNSFEFKTSGSTGVPKVITHAKTSMIVSAQITQNAFGYVAGEKALLCLPVQYISGCMMLVRSIVSDLDLIISDVTTNPLYKVYIDILDQINFAPMTPMQFENLYNMDELLFDKFNNILLGGAQVNDKQLGLIRHVKPNVFIGYGMTETITHLALRKLNHEPDNYYKVLNGFEVSLNKSDCLVISASHLSENVVTNDIVELISSDAFLWKGRIDNIINSGGLKVNPEELESLIGLHLVEDFFISSIPDESLGEKVVLVVEKKPFDSEDAKKIFISNLKSIIEKTGLSNKKPRLVFFIPSFKLTENGKLKRKAIQSSLNANDAISI